MLFSSMEFLVWFLPCFILIYYLLPNRYKNLCILIFSLVFYMYGCISNPISILLFAGSIALTFGLGRLIEDKKGNGKAWLVLGILIQVGMLFLYKYLGFFAGVFGKQLSIRLLLPLGISFYTFQSLSYLIDVYRGTVSAEKSLLRFAVYMGMFPQVISGPIVRYETVKKQLSHKDITKEGIIKGAELFVLGLGLKAILANRLSGMWSNIEAIGYQSISTPLAWMGIIAYSLQLYFDFSGYSMMAVGLGKMMGFKLPNNFNYPYISVTMTEFWRRWHITLGSWFKDYLYIPLGGNRKGVGRTYLNLLVVWLLTGFWHGASWTFLAWGLFLFLIIANEKLWFGKVLNEHRAMGHIYMMVLIPLSWMIFAITDINELLTYAGRLIGIGGVNVFHGDWQKYLSQFGLFLGAGVLFSTRIPRALFEMIKNKYVKGAVLIVLFGASLYMIYKGANDPFMYFQF